MLSQVLCNCGDKLFFINLKNVLNASRNNFTKLVYLQELEPMEASVVMK